MEVINFCIRMVIRYNVEFKKSFILVKKYLRMDFYDRRKLDWKGFIDFSLI